VKEGGDNGRIYAPEYTFPFVVKYKGEAGKNEKGYFQAIHHALAPDILYSILLFWRTGRLGGMECLASEFLLRCS
jgi:hypothetical protein